MVSLFGSTSCGTPQEIRHVYMALDNNGDRTRNVFFTDTEEIHCNADYVGDRRDLTVNAIVRITKSEACPAMLTANPGDPKCNGSWGGPLVTSNWVLAIGEVAPGTGVQTLSFSLTKTPVAPSDGGQAADPKTIPFPVGHYRCEVYVNGVAQDHADFDVQFPQKLDPSDQFNSACPVAPVQPGGTCFDFVKPGTQCPEANQSVICTCNPAGVWQCPQ
jgi:hypothetical protein